MDSVSSLHCRDQTQDIFDKMESHGGGLWPLHHNFCIAQLAGAMSKARGDMDKLFRQCPCLQHLSQWNQGPSVCKKRIAMLPVASLKQGPACTVHPLMLEAMRSC